jgi:hypothetical protein
MSSRLKEKIGSMHVGKNIKETASALVSDVKEIATDTKEATGETIDSIRKGTKKALQKVEKKLS